MIAALAFGLSTGLVIGVCLAMGIAQRIEIVEGKDNRVIKFESTRVLFCVRVKGV